MKLRRLLLRSVAVTCALILGYVAGGLVDQPLDSTPAYASDAKPASAQRDHHDHDDHAAHEKHAGSDHGSAHAAGPKAVDLIKPNLTEAPFYPFVLKLAVGLFAAAIVLGIPALKLRGPEPVEADDHHDDHAHDDHGHAHGHDVHKH